MKVARVKRINIQCTPKFYKQQEYCLTTGSTVELVEYPEGVELPWESHTTRIAIITDVIERRNSYDKYLVCLEYIDGIEGTSYIGSDGMKREYKGEARMPGIIFAKSVFARKFINIDPSDLFEVKFKTKTDYVLIDEIGCHYIIGDFVCVNIDGVLNSYIFERASINLKKKTVCVDLSTHTTITVGKVYCAGTVNMSLHEDDVKIKNGIGYKYVDIPDIRIVTDSDVYDVVEDANLIEER